MNKDTKESPRRSGEGIPRRVRSQCRFPRATQVWRGGRRAAAREERGEEMRMHGGESSRTSITSERGLTVGRGEVVGERQAERGVIWLISEND